MENSKFPSHFTAIRYRLSRVETDIPVNQKSKFSVEDRRNNLDFLPCLSLGWLVGLLFFTSCPLVFSESGPTVLGEILVTAAQARIQTLPEIAGANIYSGKKTSVIDLNEPPAIVNNNYRQTLQKTPGLLLSEESTPLLSVGYRGLDPHRAQFTQVLKDGIPIHADMFGYPEAYYTPPLQVVDRIDFIKGGSALLYGPQPGGALNFVTKDPALSPFTMTVENSGASHGLYSNYTAISGTKDNRGYYGYFHHRQSQGFRANNSQYALFSAGTKLRVHNDKGEYWDLVIDGYNEEHGEPGGLTRADFDSDLTKATRLNDYFELNRYAGSVAYERETASDSFFSFKTFGGYYERLSWRQRTTGSAFGTVPNLASNDIESQQFYTGGLEARFRQNYEAFGSPENALTAGILYYHVTSPRLDKRGSRADADDGDVRKDSDRWLNDTSIFLENLFKLGKLSVTPGLRLENIWQRVNEKMNADKTTVPLADALEYNFVPLAGLGLEYELQETVKFYSNVSQGYRPKIYTQAVPTGSGQVVNEDLEEGKSWQAELGIRGVPQDYLSWDASVFYMQFNDQIGTSDSTVENVGDAKHRGFEAALQFDLIGCWEALRNTARTKASGAVNFFSNVMILDAEFNKGPNEGKTPQYAPDFIFKTGIEYHDQDKGKLRLAGTFVDDHYANDTNTDTFAVPSYKVWDLTAEIRLDKDTFSLLGGINNIFDEKYFARVRSDGIDPADGRHYYAGLKINW